MSDQTETADRLTFWRNWYTASRQLPDDLRLAWLDAVLDFAFEGREPTPAADGASVEDGIAAAIGFQAVQMVRATIEISRKRKQSGSKGGASNKQAEAKPKQNRSKTEAKRSKAKADRKQVKEHVQVQEQEQEHNAKSSTATKTPPTITQFIQIGEFAGVPEEFSRRLHKDLTEAGWLDAKGLYVANWRRYLKSAWNAEQKKISAAREDGIGGFRIAR